MPRYVLTGAPGAGKTAVFRLLEINGHVVVEEAATDVIALDYAPGRGQPRHNHAFIDKIVNLQRQRQHSVRAAESATVLALFAAPLQPGGLQLEVPAGEAGGEHTDEPPYGSLLGEAQGDERAVAVRLDAVVRRGLRARPAGAPDKVLLLRQVGQRPHGGWQAGLPDADPLTGVQRARVHPNDLGNRRGPLWPGFHLAEHLPHHRRRRGDPDGCAPLHARRIAGASPLTGVV